MDLAVIIAELFEVTLDYLILGRTENQKNTDKCKSEKSKKALKEEIKKEVREELKDEMQQMIKEYIKETR